MARVLVSALAARAEKKKISMDGRKESKGESIEFLQLISCSLSTGEKLTVTGDRVGSLVNNFSWAVDGETIPLLHGSTIDGLLVVRKGHP